MTLANYPRILMRLANHLERKKVHKLLHAITNYVEVATKAINTIPCGQGAASPRKEGEREESKRREGTAKTERS